MNLFCCSLNCTQGVFNKIQAPILQIQRVFKEKNHFQGVFKDQAVFQKIFQACVNHGRKHLNFTQPHSSRGLVIHKKTTQVAKE